MCEIADMEAWIDRTLLEAVKEERQPEILLGFLATVGEIAAQRQGLEYLAEPMRENN